MKYKPQTIIESICFINLKKLRGEELQELLWWLRGEFWDLPSISHSRLHTYRSRSCCQCYWHYHQLWYQEFQEESENSLSWDSPMMIFSKSIFPFFLPWPSRKHGIHSIQMHLVSMILQTLFHTSCLLVHRMYQLPPAKTLVSILQDYHWVYRTKQYQKR